MRHVFILNPVAGKNHKALEIRDTIEKYFSQHPEMQYSIYLTDKKGAATDIARQESMSDDCVRIYACGGDGTLQETANGIPVGSNRVELAVIPCGSGNDYVRLFGGKEAFLDVRDIIEGSAVTVDALACGDMLSLNIAAIGMDAAVADKMQKYKHLPGVNGSMAYNLAIADVFFHPIGDDMEIEISGEEGTIHRAGRYLMTLAANGRFYGGGYMGAPNAVEDDGILDFTLVKSVPKLKIPTILGRYKNGQHEELDCVEHLRGYSMRVKSTKPTVCTVDGECFKTDAIEFKIIPSAYRFVLPASIYRLRGHRETATV